MKPIHNKKRRIVFYRNIVIISVLTLTAIISAICISALDADTGSCEDYATIANSPTPMTSQPMASIPRTESTTETISETIQVWAPDQAEVEAIAKTLYGECRGVESKAEQAAVVWCILNRVDSPRHPDTVIDVITQPYQFSGYDEDYPIWDELEELAADVLTRWHNEHEGGTNVGRTLPKDYCFFIGDGERNHFSIEWRSTSYWDWSFDNPYES